MASAIVPIALVVPSPILRRLFALEHQMHQLQDKDNQERTTTLAFAACGLCLGYPCPDGDLGAIATRFAETLGPTLNQAKLLGPITQHAYYLCLYGVPLPAAVPASPAPESPAQPKVEGTPPPASGGTHLLPEPGPLSGPRLRRLYAAALHPTGTERDRAIYLDAHREANAQGV